MNSRSSLIRNLFQLAILLSLSWHANAQQVGRLFMTQQERTEIDRIRLGGAPATKEEGATARPPDANLTVDGFVQRNGSGKSTVWVNSQAQNENERTHGSTLLSDKGKPGAVALQLPSGRNVHLKAGQSIDISTGQVREGYETGVVVSDLPSKSTSRSKR